MTTILIALAIVYISASLLFVVAIRNAPVLADRPEPASNDNVREIGRRHA